MGDGTDDTPQLFDAVLLDQLGSDSWAELLQIVRSVVISRSELEPALAELVDAPVSRLVGGRGRRRLSEYLVADEELAAAVRDELARHGSQSVIEAVSPDRPSVARAPIAHGGERSNASNQTHVAVERSTPADESTGGAKQRARRLLEERDTWRRRAEGAEARLAALHDEATAARGEIDCFRRKVASLEAAVNDAKRERDRAVDRERRRGEGERVRLQDELADYRRREQERRARDRRREEQRQGQLVGDHDQRPFADHDQRLFADDPVGDGFVAGRPSRLPADVAPGTTEAASVLLHPGRLVLVDGYNVTRRHRPQLAFDAQRSWLVQVVAQGAGARRLRPVIVFDGSAASGGKPAAGGREVQVRFTPSGITADDEIVLAVEATDEPVVVVTDDRELVARCAAASADVIGVTAFLGAITSVR